MDCQPAVRWLASISSCSFFGLIGLIGCTFNISLVAYVQGERCRVAVGLEHDAVDVHATVWPLTLFFLKRFVCARCRTASVARCTERPRWKGRLRLCYLAYVDHPLPPPPCRVFTTRSLKNGYRISRFLPISVVFTSPLHPRTLFVFFVAFCTFFVWTSLRPEPTRDGMRYPDQADLVKRLVEDDAAKAEPEVSSGGCRPGQCAC